LRAGQHCVDISISISQQHVAEQRPLVVQALLKHFRYRLFAAPATRIGLLLYSSALDNGQ
jgi:hypothetical protein